MAEGPEGPKGPNLPIAMSVTNKIFRAVGWGAKKGYEKVKEGRDRRFEENAVNELHDVMYDGVVHVPGHPRPAVRTRPLSADELRRFTEAADGLTDKKIPLPAYVTSFASRFGIRLKRPQ